VTPLHVIYTIFWSVFALVAAYVGWGFVQVFVLKGRSSKPPAGNPERMPHSASGGTGDDHSTGDFIGFDHGGGGDAGGGDLGSGDSGGGW
jgi:hypothetical protein